MPYKSPWARVYTYSGKKVNKYGQPTRQEVVCYPRDTSSQSNQNEQFSPVIIPGDRVHVRWGVAPPPGIVLSIHSLPKQFLMAVAYMETLVTERFGCGMKSCKESENHESQETTLPASVLMHPSLYSLDNIVITPAVLVHMIEMICTYLRRTDIPALIKENIFHILAQSLRILHVLEGGNGSSLSKHGSRYSAMHSFFRQLQTELKMLHNEEMSKFSPSGSTSDAANDQGLFSTYFHSLLEVNLAIAEAVQILGPSPLLPNIPYARLVEEGATASKSSSSSKKKKQKSRKHSGTPSRQSSGASLIDVDSMHSSEEALSLVTASTSLSSMVSNMSNTTSCSSMNMVSCEDLQVEDMWFYRAVNISGILRGLGFGESHTRKVLSEAVTDAAMSIMGSTAHSRLLVLIGIPQHMDVEAVKDAIKRACDVNGGIERIDIFVPPTRKTVTSLSSESGMGLAKAKDLDNEKDNIKSKVTAPVIKSRGWAVINLPTKANTESVQKSLYKCKPLIESLNCDPEEFVDIPDEVFSVSVVNQMLLSEPPANGAVELYLQDKLFQKEADRELTDTALQIITEIFHSCFFVIQQQGSSGWWQESGFICLEKEHILNSSADNLLYIFLNQLRPTKKPLGDYVNPLLRQYGMVITQDKDKDT